MRAIMLTIVVTCMLFATMQMAAMAQNLVDPGFPSLPDNFGAALEANIMNKEYSIDIYEYYDYVNNRVRLENYRRNSSMISIYDYNRQRHFNIINGVCTVYNTTQEHRNGMNFDPSTGHLRRTADLFALTNNLTKTYTGVRTARGILCDHWTAGVNMNFTTPFGSVRIMNYTMEWFFAVSNWSIRGMESDTRFPVLIKIEGTDTAIINGTTTVSPFAHNYEWVDFVPGLPDDSVFELPEHMLCADIVQLPFPATPVTLQTIVEVTSSVGSEITGSFHEYYDYENNYFRYEGFRPMTGYIQEVYHFGDNTYYTVINHTTCQAQPINFNFPFYDPATKHVRRFNDSLLTLANGSLATPIYAGVQSIRGVECNKWFYNATRTNPDVNYTVVLYFAVNTWHFFDNINDYQRLIRREVYASSINSTGQLVNRHVVYSYVDMSETIVFPRVFEIPRQCPGAEPRTRRSTVHWRGLSNGGVVGVSFLAAILGALIGVAAIKIKQKRDAAKFRLDTDSELASSSRK